MKLIRFEQPAELMQLGSAAGTGTIGGRYNIFNPPPKQSTSPTSLFGNPQTFTAAADTQASDYDKIMASYRNLVTQFSQNPITAERIGTSPVQAQQVAPTTAGYSESPDVARSLAGLSDLATTGGYSQADIANIRERDISPIRSIYANAQQEVERQRALSGGYSPNFDAVQAEMARNEAQQIADTTTSANAGIAQNVATNRISAASPYASASAAENAARTGVGVTNAQFANQVALANQQAGLSAAQGNQQAGLYAGAANQKAFLDAQLANRQSLFAPIQGQANLYGTTPALTKTFGDQVVQASQLGQGQQNINNQNRRSVLGAIG